MPSFFVLIKNQVEDRKKGRNSRFSSAGGKPPNTRTGGIPCMETAGWP
jgi:hypothetical protein